MKVFIETDFPERFKMLDYVLLCKKGECKYFPLINVKYYKNQVILQLTGIYDRDQADLYRGYDVCIKEEDKLPTEENEFYIFELIGLDVVDQENNRIIGQIEDVYTGGHQDILFVKKQNGKRILIPMVKSFIREINTENGYILVSLIDGFVEY